MLTLKQQLEALLIEAKAKTTKATVKPVVQPTEPDEVDDSEDDYILKAVPDDAIIDREAMMVKGEAPEEEDLSTEGELDFNSPDGEEDEEEENDSNSTKGVVDWAKARNEPDTLRRFINFFLNKPTEYGSESLNKDLSRFIEEGFDPDRNGPFKTALDEVLIFYTDFRRSLINKEPTGIIVDLLQELSEKKPTDLERERWDPESDDPHLAKDNTKALKTLEKSFTRDARSITRWINKSQATSSSIADLTKDDLDNLFIAVNISNNYLYYKYENMAQWEKRYNALMRQDKKKEKNKKDDEEEEIDYAPGEGLAIPHEDTKIFLFGFDPEKGQDPTDQTYFFTNYFRSLYSPSTTALKKFANSNSGALQTITKFLGPIDPKLLSEMNLSRYAHSLLGEGLVGDVGDKDILFGQFCSEITVWFLVALLFGESKDTVFGKAIVRALKTVSYLSQAGLTSSASSSNAPQINSMDAKNPGTGAYNSEDIGSVNAVTGAPDQELTLDKLIYDKFWDTLVALANVFNIGKNPSNLTRTIADTFAKVPVDAFTGDCEYYKVDSAGSIIPANLLGEYQSFAVDVTKDSEYLVRELGAILSFLRGRDLFSERDITEKMKGLPKTFEDGLKAFNFSPSGVSEDTNNSASEAINQLYSELCDHVPRFRGISPGLGSTIKREYLSPTSEMSEYFGITPLDPNATSVVDVPDARRDQVALKNRKVDFNSPEEKQKSDLKQKFEDYFGVVKDMLQPPLGNKDDLAKWGFLHLTPLSIDRPSDAWEKQFVMYPIYDDKGKDITRKYGKKHLVIFPDAVAYNNVAKEILRVLRSQESAFLAAKTPEDLEAALSTVCSVIPENRIDMLSFRSPLTISYPDKKTQSLPLAFLISPRKPNAGGKQYGAMVPALYNKPIGVLKNPGVFAIFAAETLKVNNLVRTSTTPLDDGRIKSYINVLIEADASRYTVSPKLVPFAIMNIHLRAKTLIAVSELFDKINRVLETFRRIIDKIEADQAKIALAILPHHEKHEAGDDMVDILTTAAAKSLTVPEGFDITEIEDEALAELNDTFKDSNVVLDTARGLRDKVKTMKFGSIRVKA